MPHKHTQYRIHTAIISINTTITMELQNILKSCILLHIKRSMVNTKKNIKNIYIIGDKQLIGNERKERSKDVPETAHPRPPKGRGHPTISHGRYSTKHEAQRKLTHLNSNDDRLTYSSYKDGDKCNYLQENHLQTASPSRSLHIHRNTTKGYS